MSAPVRHTCPDIDKMQSAIRTAIDSCKWAQRKNDDDINRDVIDEMIDAFETLSGKLEDLRSDNDQLRTWGHELEEKIEELEEQINQMNIV